jgi:NarL family two-component system sensor histidine kinase YdfH
MWDSNDPKTFREETKDTWPFFVIVTLVIVVGYASALSTIDSLRETPRLILFSALMVLIGGLFWIGPVLLSSPRRLMALLLTQCGAAFVVGLLTPGHWLILALFPALAGMAIGAYWPNLLKCLAAASSIFVLLAVNIAIGKGLDEALVFLPYVGLTLIFVSIYVVLFVRQVETKKKAQSLLKELEVAHEHLRQYADRVEELTLSQERERMGHELHDTLAQGVAGLIMQLEAVEVHLESGDEKRAGEVLKQAIARARSTHHEARRAIQALRASVLDELDLIEAIRHEVDQFTTTGDTSCRFDTAVTSLNLAPEKAQHTLRIVQEGLSNVARHAQASQAFVGLEESHDAFSVTIEDDGIGFDTSLPKDGFGLVGMQERAARIEGDLKIASEPNKGTRIELRIKKSRP